MKDFKKERKKLNEKQERLSVLRMLSIERDFFFVNFDYVVENFARIKFKRFVKVKHVDRFVIWHVVLFFILNALL